MGDTLVLSSGYEAIGHIDWRRAITLLYEKKVEVVETYDDWTVRSVNLSIAVPSVIRNLVGTNRRKKAVRFSRQNVYTRDRGICQYCNKHVPMDDFTYDHVTPRVQGGQTRWENVVISCIPCNQKKGGRRPEQAKMKLLSVPVKPKNQPGGMSFTFRYKDGMPEAWRKWIRDQAYWNVPLDEE